VVNVSAVGLQPDVLQVFSLLNKPIYFFRGHLSSMLEWCLQATDIPNWQNKLSLVTPHNSDVSLQNDKVLAGLGSSWPLLPKEQQCWCRTGLECRGSIPGRGKGFSLLHNVQTGSEAHPASYLMGTGGSFAVGKAAGAWSWLLISI
jgi:hypothetical protein